MATPAWELIDSNTLTSATSSVTFSSIPSTYRDLVLVINGEADGTIAALAYRLNGDTSSAYSIVNMIGRAAGTGILSYSATGTSAGFTQAGIEGSERGMFKLDFLDYSATDKHKTTLIRSDYYADGQASLTTEAYATRWANTSAVTSITIPIAGGGMKAGTTFSLWGLNKL